MGKDKFSGSTNIKVTFKAEEGAGSTNVLFNHEIRSKRKSRGTDVCSCVTNVKPRSRAKTKGLEVFF